MSERVSNALRRQLYQIARHRCEYCLYPADLADFPHEPDHIVPLQHGGKTELDNLALACFPCNRRKGPNVGSYDELTGQLTRLFHPRHDAWLTHFELVNGFIRPKTDIGRVTVRLLTLNDDRRVCERLLAMELGLLKVQDA